MTVAWVTPFRFLVFSATLAVFSAIGEAAPIGDSQSLSSWRSRFDGLLKQGQCDKAGEALDNIDRIAGRPSADDHETLAGCYYEQDRYQKAAEQLELALPLWTAPEKRIGTLYTLGVVYDCLGDYEKAESKLRAGLEALGDWPPSGARDSRVAAFRQGLGELYRHRGAFCEAEPHLRGALRLRQMHFPSSSREVRDSRLALAELYRRQAKRTDAFLLLQEALKIADPKDQDTRALVYSCLARVYYDTGWDLSGDEKDKWWATAEAYHTKALEAFRKSELRGTPYHADCLNDLGFLYQRQNRFAEAESYYRESLEIVKDLPSPDPARIVDTLNNLARLCYDRRDLSAAQRYLEEAIKQPGAVVSLEHRYTSQFWQGRILWDRGRRDQALDCVRKAMDLAVEQRSLGSGTAHDRAQYFTQLTDAFELMVRCQVELAAEDQEPNKAGHVREAYQAIERARALSLLDQMGLQGVDVLAGLPAVQAERLGGARNRRLGKMTALQRELDAQRDSAEPTQVLTLELELDKAKAEYRATEREIWNLSPVCRRAVGSPHQPKPLAHLRKWTAEKRALVLEYVLGREGAYLLVVPPEGDPWLEALTLNDELAQVLGVQPGPLTAARVQTALLNQATGVIYDLASSDIAVPTDVLFALWQALVPPRVRSALLDASLERLAIIPDATLALLPYEALVVDPADGPKYLLDVGPPVAYAPSVTVLLELAQASAAGAAAAHVPSARSDAGREPVLSVAKWDYRDRQGWPSLDSIEDEAEAVLDRFQEAHVPIRQITNVRATEARMRAEISDRWLVHLACHGESERTADPGETEQDYGNPLGRLILTGAGEEPSNDGDLVLPEICELNLKGCELVLLSACKTNYGPTLRGEGVFALTRAFLTAGAHRVMTTQWNVDDEATACLIDALCLFLLENREADEGIDYAALLHKAKQHVRKRWECPYYWAPMVLVGPY